MSAASSLTGSYRNIGSGTRNIADALQSISDLGGKKAQRRIRVAELKVKKKTAETNRQRNKLRAKELGLNKDEMKNIFR